MGTFNDLMTTNLVQSYPDVVGPRWQRRETDRVVVVCFVVEGHGGM